MNHLHPPQQCQFEVRCDSRIMGFFRTSRVYSNMEFSIRAGVTCLSMLTSQLICNSEHVFLETLLVGSYLLASNGYKIISLLAVASAAATYPLSICILPVVMSISNYSKVSIRGCDVLQRLLCISTVAIMLSKFWTASSTIYEGDTSVLLLSGYEKFKNTQFLYGKDAITSIERMCDAWIYAMYCCWRLIVTILTSESESITGEHYTPSLGVRWYLDAQMLPEYRSYFDCLFALQPIICAGLLQRYLAGTRCGSLLAVSTLSSYTVL